MDDDKKANNDKETILRLRGALASMNQDYMKTKLELDQIKNQSSSSSEPTTKAADIGASLFKFSSKVKAFQSNVNAKLATAGIQINKLSDSSSDLTSATTMTTTTTTNTSSSTTTNGNIDDNINKHNKHNKELRKLRDDIESLQTQMTNLKLMLKTSMEEKDQIQKERNELLIKHGEAEEQIKKLKQQSIDDSNRYEQLLDSFRAENSSQIEIEKKKLYKECDEKITNLNKECEEYKEKYQEMVNKWKENEEKWHEKFDLIVTERNSLKRKVKSLQTDLTEYLNKNNNNNNHINVNDHDDEEEENDINYQIQIKQKKEIDQLKNEINTLKKKHLNEKTSLLSNIQRLSSKSSAQNSFKGNDVQFLVNSLSQLVAEKEDIIASLQTSKLYLGQRVLELENNLNNK